MGGEMVCGCTFAGARGAIRVGCLAGNRAVTVEGGIGTHLP